MAIGSNKNTRVSNNTGYKNLSHRGRPNTPRADYYGNSIPNNECLAKYVKDTLDDPDGMEGLVFNRWIADMKWLGIPIPWEEFI